MQQNSLELQTLALGLSKWRLPWNHYFNSKDGRFTEMEFKCCLSLYYFFFFWSASFAVENGQLIRQFIFCMVLPSTLCSICSFRPELIQGSENRQIKINTSFVLGFSIVLSVLSIYIPHHHSIWVSHNLSHMLVFIKALQRREVLLTNEKPRHRLA